MNIENLRRLINGESLNTPSVSSVSDFAFESGSVRAGYAYIAVGANAQDIAAAVANGAYAVLVETDCEVIDKEVAFIKVDSLSTAIMRLVRFESSYKNLKFCLVNSLQKAVLSRMSLAKGAGLLPNEMQKIFIKIMRANSGDFFFTDDMKILSKIAPLYESVSSDMATTMPTSSVFTTSLVCGGVYYKELNFPKVFASYLSGLIEYLNKNAISFKLGDMRNLGHFEPIFVDRKFKILPFGASQQVFIAEDDETLFELEANFLLQNFSGGIEICTPRGFDSPIQPTFKFTNLSTLKNLKNFHYALVKCQKSELEAILGTTQNEVNLFG